MFKAPAVALALILCAPTGHAKNADENLSRLMELSGVTQSIAAMPKVISSEMNQEQLTAQIGDPDVATVISNALQSSITAPLFQRSISQSLRERLSDDEVSLLLGWYATPLGKRVAAANQSDQFTIDQRVNAGERPQLSAERRALFLKLDQVSMGSDNTVRLAVDTAAIMGHSMMSSMGMPIGMAEFRAMAEMEMEGQKTQIVEEYLATLAFMYESLSESELEQLIAYMFQPEATVFFDAMWSGLRTAFHEGGAAMGSALVAELQGSF